MIDTPTVSAIYPQDQLLCQPWSTNRRQQLSSQSCVSLSVLVAPIKFLQQLKRRERGEHQHISMSLLLSVQSYKNKPNSAFNHFYSREDTKRLPSKMRDTSKKEKSAGMKQRSLLWGSYGSCESFRSLGSQEPGDVRMESSAFF